MTKKTKRAKERDTSEPWAEDMENEGEVEVLDREDEDKAEAEAEEIQTEPVRDTRPGEEYVPDPEPKADPELTPLVLSPFPDPPYDPAIRGMTGSHKVGLLPPGDYTLAPGELFTEVDPNVTTTAPRIWVGLWTRGRGIKGGDVHLMFDNAPGLEAVDVGITFASATDKGKYQVLCTGLNPNNKLIEVAAYRAPMPTDVVPGGPFGRMIRPFTLATTTAGSWSVTLQLSSPGVYNFTARQRHNPDGTYWQVLNLTVGAP